MTAESNGTITSAQRNMTQYSAPSPHAAVIDCFAADGVAERVGRSRCLWCSIDGNNVQSVPPGQPEGTTARRVGARSVKAARLEHGDVHASARRHTEGSGEFLELTNRPGP